MRCFSGPVIYKKSLESTNDFMLEQISAGSISDEGTVVTAYSQTHGKGFGNTVWESKPGKNLTISVLLKPDFLRAEHQFLLNKVVSLAVKDFICLHVTGHPVRVKWPNDIYIGDRKVAGILINNTISGNRMIYAVAGIGMNINQKNFSGIASNPVSVIHFTGNVLDRHECLKEFLVCLDERYCELKQGNLRQIDSDYFSSLYRLNQFHSFIYQGENVSGKITGINEYGFLNLTLTGDRRVECDFKEIEFVI
jgi:BirA family biotin operon repressor/biotin-[acetyl-CoA-carboxylase] ligase